MNDGGPDTAATQLCWLCVRKWLS